MIPSRSGAVRRGQAPWFAPLVALGILSGCQTIDAIWPEQQADPRAHWRITQHIGEAHVLVPGQSRWGTAAEGDALAPGTKIRTGAGGQLVLASPGANVVVGPASALALGVEGEVRQEAGEARYRLDAPHALLTPHLRAHTSPAAVLDLSVRADATTVEVEAGQIEIEGETTLALDAGGVARVEPGGIARLFAAGGEESGPGAQTPSSEGPLGIAAALAPPRRADGTEMSAPPGGESGPVALAATGGAASLVPPQSSGPRALIGAASPPPGAIAAPRVVGMRASAEDSEPRSSAAQAGTIAPAAQPSAIGLPPAPLERVIVPGRSPAGGGSGPVGAGPFDRLVGGLLDGVSRVRITPPEG